LPFFITPSRETSYPKKHRADFRIAQFYLSAIALFHRLSDFGFEIGGHSMPVDEKYYSPKEAAEKLQCDEERVLEGDLVAANIASSKSAQRPRWRIAEADLGRFLLSRRNVQSLAEPKPKRIEKPKKKFI
jgi:hypothetical protein